MSNTKRACSGEVHDGWRPYPCHKKGKFHENGKWWCGIHAPSKEEARRDKREAKLRAKYESEKESRYTAEKERRDKITKPYRALLKEARPYLLYDDAITHSGKLLKRIDEAVGEEE